MSTATTATTTEFYLQFKILPDACRPMWVVRDDGCTLLIIDPRTTRFQAMMGLRDRLTDAECEGFRLAYGGPPTGEPAPDYWTTDDPVIIHVPDALYLPSTAPSLEDVRHYRLVAPRQPEESTA